MTAPAFSRPRRLRRAVTAAVVAVALGTLLTAVVAWLNVRGEAPLPPPGATAVVDSPAVRQQGAYLARAGNCIGCHTAPGGAELAGGRAIETPFGTVFAPNLTPDVPTGIGAWSPDEFWRALHHGRAPDGRLLYPAFPYPRFTIVTRADADALYVFLRSIPPVVQPNRPHRLRFPYRSQAALALWRALFFRPGEFVPDAGRSAGWNRGKYLVQGLGHCAACHSERNLLGAVGIGAEFIGGLMPGDSWYAPSLADPGEGGVQGWPRDDIVRLLQHGIAERASVAGPMADVVYDGTRYLDPRDLQAMAAFLQSIPVRERDAAEAAPAAPPEVFSRGQQVYEQHCAACHGGDGRGVAGIYPALAGNRAVTLAVANNVVQVIRHGGFAPSTAGHPQPFGMPPFGHLLDVEDIAAVATYIRRSWGHRAGAVTPLEVLRIP